MGRKDGATGDDPAPAAEDVEKTPPKATCCSRFKRIFALTKEGATPPNWSVIILCFITMFAAAYSMTFLFPFLPDMVLFFGYEEEEKGYIAGLIASSFFFGRIFGSYFWGWLSDKKGRKPILISNLILLAVTNLAFGFSTNFITAMITRFLNGLVNGVVATCKTILYEVSDDTNQAVGMSIVALSWGAGAITGPLISGFLSEPAKKYSSLEGDPLLTKFPFLLPGVVAAFFALGTMIIAWVKLPETNKKFAHVEEMDTLEVGIGNEPIATPSLARRHPDSSYAGDSPAHLNGLMKPSPGQCSQQSLDRSGGAAPAPSSQHRPSYYSFLSETDDVHNITAYDPLCDDIDFMDGDNKSEHQLTFGLGCSMPSLDSYSSRYPSMDLAKYDLAPSEIGPSRDNVFVDASKGGLDESGIDEDDVKKSRCEKNSFLQLLRIKEVRYSVALFSLFSFNAIGWGEVFIVWASTDVSLEGLGFSAEQLGQAIGFSALPLMVLQLYIFPKCVAAFGAIRTFEIFCIYLIVCSVGIVCLRVLHSQPDVMWPLLMLLMGLEKVAGVTCYSSSSLFLNNSVPPEMAGKINGLAMTFAAMLRTLAPTLGGSIFAWSITSGVRIGFPFDVNLTFILFGLIYFTCNCLCSIMPSNMETQTKKGDENTKVPTVTEKVDTQPVKAVSHQPPIKKAARL